MSRWLVAATMVAMMGGAADARVARTRPATQPPLAHGLTPIDFRLQPSDGDERFLLPVVDARFEQQPPKPKVRLRGTRVKLRLPI